MNDDRPTDSDPARDELSIASILNGWVDVNELKRIRSYRWSMSTSTSGFHAKDFIETQEGLCFAVVADGVEQDRVLGRLRYHKFDSRWQKLSTNAAERLIRQEYPTFHFHSPLRDATLPHCGTQRYTGFRLTR